MRQDEAAMNDFVPPRQAMNSDESDFDWDEDINIDESGQVHKKKQTKDNVSHWRKLSPFLRMVISVLVGSPIVALPAILVSILMDDDPEGAYPTKATVMMIFVWLSFMWGIIFITNWGIDIVPVVVVRLTGFVTGSRSENLKSKLLVRCITHSSWPWQLQAGWRLSCSKEGSRLFCLHLHFSLAFTMTPSDLSSFPWFCLTYDVIDIFLLPPIDLPSFPSTYLDVRGMQKVPQMAPRLLLGHRLLRLPLQFALQDHQRPNGDHLHRSPRLFRRRICTCLCREDSFTSHLDKLPPDRLCGPDYGKQVCAHCFGSPFDLQEGEC